MSSIINISHDVHYLKVETDVFKNIKNGDDQFKTKADKDYKVNDTLILEEFNSDLGRCSRAWAPKLITDIQEKENYVILSLKDIKF